MFVGKVTYVSWASKLSYFADEVKLLFWRDSPSLWHINIHVKEQPVVHSACCIVKN